jgi:predicted ATPase
VREQEQQHSARSCVEMKDQNVFLHDDAETHRTFRFDHCFDSSEGPKNGSGQRDIFDTLGSKVLDHAWAGFNSSIFAYGQTGSGKTYRQVRRIGEGVGSAVVAEWHGH